MCAMKLFTHEQTSLVRTLLIVYILTLGIFVGTYLYAVSKFANYVTSDLTAVNKFITWFNDPTWDLAFVIVLFLFINQYALTKFTEVITVYTNWRLLTKKQCMVYKCLALLVPVLAIFNLVIFELIF